MKQIHQTSTTSFSFARYLALLKTYLVENKKSLGLYVGTIFGLFILIGLRIGFSNIYALATDDWENSWSTREMVGYTHTVFVICSVITASLTFSTLQTRATRITTLMLPASMLEKYLVRLTVYLPIYLVVFVISFICGDAVRLLLSNAQVVSAPSWFINNYAQEENVFFMAFTIIVHAIYTLGSAMWPRKSVLITTVILIIMIIIMSYINIDLIDYVFTKLENARGREIISGSIAIAAVIYWLAWLRFKSTRIVQRFMMN